MAIATPQEYLAMYRLTSVSGQDPAFATLISRADQLMAIACNMPANDAGAFTLEASTYTLHPCRSTTHRRCLLVGMRVPTLISAAYVSDAWTYDADSLVPASDYAYETRSGELWLSSGSAFAWSREPRANRVVTWSGWASGAAPEAVKHWALVQTRYLLELSRLQAGDPASQASGWFTPTQAELLLAPGVREALAPYRYTADPLPEEQPTAA